MTSFSFVGKHVQTILYQPNTDRWVTPGREGMNKNTNCYLIGMQHCMHTIHLLREVQCIHTYFY